MGELIVLNKREIKKKLKAVKSKSKDLNVSRPTLDNLRTELATVFSLIPIAEKQYKKYPGEKNANALYKLLSLANELMQKIEELERQDLLESTKTVLEDLIRELIESLALAIREQKELFKDNKVEKALTHVFKKFAEASKDVLDRKIKEIESLVLRPKK